MNYEEEAKQIVLVLRAVQAADTQGIHPDADIGWIERARFYKLIFWGGFTDNSSRYMLTPIGRLMLAAVDANAPVCPSGLPAGQAKVKDPLDGSESPCYCPACAAISP